MRIVITGSEGFIGTHLFDALDTGHELLAIDLATGDDILSDRTAAAIQGFDPHIVFHLAAKHYIPWTQRHPGATAKVNITGTGRMLAATGPSLRAFVLASSGAVYGFDPDPIPETHPLLGDSAYAWSKRMAESFVEAFTRRRSDVKAVAARLFNVAGDGDHTAHVIPVIAQVAHHDGAVGLGNIWPKRDYVHVADVTDALVFLSERAPVGFSAWNVGTGVASSVADVIQTFSRVTGKTLRMQDTSDPREDDGHLVADPTALANLGWSATRTLEDAVRGALVGVPA